ncbi:hypothetical protein BDK92_2156 [Micromonospora pisi]|uniref:Uncharacterized protein n=1 Tax=Micromonospora pisi TaxID=589240 RepID=A0A495JGD3_9ACTN|nr:hypothetical protein BDK92_2156 [Micromonospora pisi]
MHDPVVEPDPPRRSPGPDRHRGESSGGGGHRGGNGAGHGNGSDDRDSERGLRGLIGSGASQVGVSAAMRARDASRPTEADLAEAEQRVVVIRRNWVPREDLPRNGR